MQKPDIARHVITLTAQAWGVPPLTPQAIARRAPYGHVPLRVARRQLWAAQARAQFPLAFTW